VKALILTHHPEEGPGILEERGWKMDEVGLWNGYSLPDPTPFHLLVLMGGPMSVNDDDLPCDTPGMQELLAALSPIDRNGV